MKLFIKITIFLNYLLWANNSSPNIINNHQDYVYLNSWLLLTQKKDIPLNFNNIEFNNLINTSISTHRINIGKQLGLQTNQDLYYFMSINLLAQIDRTLYENKVLYFNTKKNHTIELFLDGKLFEKNKSFITIETKSLRFTKKLCLKISAPKGEFNQGLLLAASKKNNIKISLNQQEWLAPLSRYQSRFINKTFFIKYLLDYKLQEQQAIEVSYSPDISNISLNQQLLTKNIIPIESLKEKNIIIYQTQRFPLFFINELNLKLQFYQKHKFILYSQSFSLKSDAIFRAYIYIEKNKKRHFIGVFNAPDTIFQVPKSLFTTNNKLIIFSLGKKNNHKIDIIPQDASLEKKFFLNFSNNTNMSPINFNLFFNSPIIQYNENSLTTNFFINNLKFDYFVDFFTYHKKNYFEQGINILPTAIYLNGQKININKRLREQGLIIGKNSLKITGLIKNRNIIYPYLKMYPLDTKTIVTPKQLSTYSKLNLFPQIVVKNKLSKRKALFLYQSLNLPQKRFLQWYNKIK